MCSAVVRRLYLCKDGSPCYVFFIEKWMYNTCNSEMTENVY